VDDIQAVGLAGVLSLSDKEHKIQDAIGFYFLTGFPVKLGMTCGL
jgi:hypothetical protein